MTHDTWDVVSYPDERARITRTWKQNTKLLLRPDGDEVRRKGTVPTSHNIAIPAFGLNQIQRKMMMMTTMMIIIIIPVLSYCVNCKDYMRSNEVCQEGWVYLFITVLYNDVRTSDYISSNGRISVNNEMERTWKEAAMSDLRYYPGNCLEGLRNTTSTNDISQEIRYCGGDSNRSPPEYKAKALPLEPTCSATDMCIRGS
jgi:hypothetical protein